MDDRAFSRYSWSTGLPSKFHLPNWTLMFDPLSKQTLSAPIENAVHFRSVRFVVDYAAVDFDPRVGLERHLLRANHQLRRDTAFPQKASRGSRALQAQRFFPIPDAGHVHGLADSFDRIGSRCPRSDRIIADLVVQRREVPSGQVEVEMDQLQVCFEDEKRHKKNLQFHAD